MHMFAISVWYQLFCTNRQKHQRESNNIWLMKRTSGICVTVDNLCSQVDLSLK